MTSSGSFLEPRSRKYCRSWGAFQYQKCSKPLAGYSRQKDSSSISELQIDYAPMFTRNNDCRVMRTADRVDRFRRLRSQASYEYE